MKQWIPIAVILIFILSFSPVEAEGLVDIKVEIGLHGKIKQSRWAPIHVTITNQGDEVSGDLVVKAAPDEQWYGTYTFPMSLSKGGVKEISLSLPVGYNPFNPKNLEVSFYEGGYKKGKPVELANKIRIVSDFVQPEELLIGALTKDPDGLKFFLTVSNPISGSARPEMVFLSEKDIPDHYQNLDSLDILVVDRFPADTLTSVQMNAIKEWIRSGGVMILSGGGSYRETVLPFSDISPVIPRGTRESKELSSLSSYAEEEINSPQPVTLSVGDLAEGKVIVSFEEIPGITIRSYGQGQVIYTAYDLTAEPFSSWKGNSKLWSNVFKEIGPEFFYKKLNYSRLFDRMYSLMNGVERFPDLKVPSVSLLMISFVIYILLITFGLYLILKRFDKREWMWVIIPSAGVLFSLIIFVTGASERLGGVLKHTLAVVELDGMGNGKGRAASAIFVPRGGDYRLTSSEQMIPISSRFMQNPMEKASSILISQTQNKSQVEFLDVDYWSVQKVYADLMPESYGRIDSDLRLSEGRLTGIVTNETSFDMNDARILVGRKYVELGSMKKGENKKVDVQIGLQGIGNLSPDMDLVYQMYSQYYNSPYQPNANYDSRKGSLLEQVLRTNDRVAYATPVKPGTFTTSPKEKFNLPMIIGWVDQPVFQYEVNEKVKSDNHLSLIYQNLNVSIQNGNTFAIPHGYVNPSVNQLTTDYQPEGLQRVYMGVGTAELEFMLPVPEKGKVDQMELRLDNPPFVSYDLYNWGKNQWERIFGPTAKLDDPPSYIKGNRVRIRLTTTRDGGFEKPTIQVKGVIEK
ncbi:hypothetical protein L1765_03700 [Microaerobacter geothermalis]|uniref:DUF7408 domain-containing protein n=1 Tax=Microaerobacter geothermalis TaxID=674972 RepID=UPI001F47C785|nr:hypothetical protein [Microaerobacter geothermalis]MCF6093098.1 hypothetical protein [Microaerobacter geothermalis]